MEKSEKIKEVIRIIIQHGLWIDLKTPITCEYIAEYYDPACDKLKCLYLTFEANCVHAYPWYDIGVELIQEAEDLYRMMSINLENEDDVVNELYNQLVRDE